MKYKNNVLQIDDDEIMIKIKDIKTALLLFEEASKKQAEATENGDYKIGNKNYSIIIRAATFLKEEKAIEKLHGFFSNTSIGVRLWSASYLLPIYENECTDVLKEIIKTKSIHSLTAETILYEWKNGNLKL